MTTTQTAKASRRARTNGVARESGSSSSFDLTVPGRPSTCSVLRPHVDCAKVTPSFDSPCAPQVIPTPKPITPSSEITAIALSTAPGRP